MRVDLMLRYLGFTFWLMERACINCSSPVSLYTGRTTRWSLSDHPILYSAARSREIPACKSHRAPVSWLLTGCMSPGRDNVPELLRSACAASLAALMSSMLLSPCGTNSECPHRKQYPRTPFRLLTSHSSVSFETALWEWTNRTLLLHSCPS